MERSSTLLFPLEISVMDQKLRETSFEEQPLKKKVNETPIFFPYLMSLRTIWIYVNRILFSFLPNASTNLEEVSSFYFFIITSILTCL